MNASITDTVRTERKHATVTFPTPAGRAAQEVDDKATVAAAAWEAAAKPPIWVDESDAVFLPSTPIPACMVGVLFVLACGVVHCLLLFVF
jgi:hypothetical protein